MSGGPRSGGIRGVISASPPHPSRRPSASSGRGRSHNRQPNPAEFDTSAVGWPSPDPLRHSAWPGLAWGMDVNTSPHPLEPERYCPRTDVREVSKSTEASRCQGVGRVAVGVSGTARAPSRKPVTTWGGRIRPPSVARRNERRGHCLRGNNRRVRGLSVSTPNTLHRSLAMELRPLSARSAGVSMATPARHTGKERPIRGA